MDTERFNPKPSFKTLSGRNLMEYTFYQEEAGAILEYQLEMLANNHIPGLLPSEVIRVNDEIRLSFDITSHISMKKLFERREVGREEFLNFLKQIIALLEGLDEYLLEGGGVVFDNQLIFVNPQDLSMAFAYLPLKEMPQTLESLKSLLLHSIIYDIRFRNEPSDNFVQRLIELLKAQELNASALKAYVKAMEEKTVSLPQSFSHEMAQQQTKASSPVEPQKEHKVKTPFGLKKPEPQNMQKPHSPQNPSQQQKVIKWDYPSKSYIILGSVLAAFLLLGIALSFTETLSIHNPDFFLSLFGYLMIGGAVTYLIYTKLFTQDKRVEKAVSKKAAPIQPPKPKKNALYMPTQRITPRLETKPTPIPPKSMAYVNKAFAIPEPGLNQAKFEAGVALEPRGTGLREHTEDHTVLLDAAVLNHPYLKGLHENISETIVLFSFPFMLGRLDGQVDYCFKNPAVGKLHAEISKSQEGYFITDMNTRNGTLIEGERLEPTKVYKLENGTHVTFANEEFIFYEGRKENQ